MSDDSTSVGTQCSGFSRPLQIVAIVLVCAVFPLLFVGAGVTSKDAGMAFPDWPTSSGYLLNPPNWLEQEDTLWEHGHRLLGWAVGMLAIVVTVLSWPCRGVRRWLALSTLLAISVQGILGGYRVKHDSIELAMIHGIWGQVCFCLACSTALVSTRAWLRNRAAIAVPAAGMLQRLCLAATAGLFIQLTLGAWLRHFGTDFALAAHLLWAVVSAVLVGWVVLWVIGNHPGRDLVETLGWMLGGFMVVQFALGGVALIVVHLAPAPNSFVYWAVPSAHVAVGALLLACSALLTLCAYRMLRAADCKEGTSTAASRSPSPGPNATSAVTT
jgi:heme a synthase